MIDRRRSFVCTLCVVLHAGLLLSAHATAADAPRAEYHFIFGPTTRLTGDPRVPVAAEDIYTNDRGYGFEPSAKVTAVSLGGSQPPHAGYCTSDAPFFFSVAVPEGNYKVTVTLGGATEP